MVFFTKKRKIVLIDVLSMVASASLILGLFEDSIKGYLLGLASLGMALLLADDHKE